MSVTVANTTASLSGKTLAKLEDSQTFTGLKTFDLGASAPFAVVSGAAKVANLDADKLDGQTGTDYHDASLLTGTYAALDGSAITSLTPGNLSTVVPIAKGGTNSSATATAGGVGYGTGTAHAYTAAGTAGQLVVSGGAGAPTFLNPPLVLLKANSGSTTNAAAEDVDTFAITGLTANDRLEIRVQIQSVTQATASANIRNATDAVTITDVYDSGLGAMPANSVVAAVSNIGQFQSAATTVGSVTPYKSTAGSGVMGATSTFTTDWTGAWTIALRQGGVTAGGTFRWSWSIYALKGQ